MDQQKEARRERKKRASESKRKKRFISEHLHLLCFGYYLQTILGLIVVEVQARAVATDTHLLDIVISRFLIRFRLRRFTFHSAN